MNNNERSSSILIPQVEILDLWRSLIKRLQVNEGAGATVEEALGKSNIRLASKKELEVVARYLNAYPESPESISWYKDIYYFGEPNNEKLNAPLLHWNGVQYQVSSYGIRAKWDPSFRMVF